MSNTITAYFKGRIGVAESVYQNDYGIVMAFDSIDLPAHFDCYFSVPGSDTATAAVGADNRVVIPNSVLGNSGSMSVHIPLHTGANDSEVEYIIYFKVIGRARPEDDGTPAQMTAIEQALALLQTPITNIEEIVNEALSFTGDTFDEMQEQLDTWKGGVESDFSNLNAQFQTAVGALTVDDELLNVRVGADGITDATAGASVRRQFGFMNTAIANLMGEAADLSKNVRPEGWETASATLTFEDNILKIDASGQYGGGKSGVSVLANHCYYYYALVKTTSNNVSLSWNGNHAVMHSGNGSDYELLSNTNTFTSTGTQKLSILDGRASNRDTIYVKEIGVIDLTGCFGAGNEPSKADMDRIISYADYRIIKTLPVGSLSKANLEDLLNVKDSLSVLKADPVAKNVTISSVTNEINIAREGSLYRADNITVKTDGTAYCGVHFYLRNLKEGQTVKVKAVRTGGNYVGIIRADCYDSNDQRINAEHVSTTSEIEQVVLDGTDYVEITLFACWGVALAANTQVVFSNVEISVAELSSENDIYLRPIGKDSVIKSTNSEVAANTASRLYKADQLVISTNGNAYCGVYFYIDKPNIGDVITVKCKSRVNGNAPMIMRADCLDANGTRLLGRENSTAEKVLNCLVLENTERVEVTLFGCWGTALPANTQVTFNGVEIRTSEVFGESGNVLYTGEPIVITDEYKKVNKCNYALWKDFVGADIPGLAAYNLYKHQSMAIFDDYVFMLNEGGDGIVLDYNTKEILSAISTQPTAYQHHNSAQFTNIYYDDNDEFPLLMTSMCGNQLDELTDYDPAQFYRITRDGTSFTFTLINTISADFITRGCSWGIDIGNNKLYMIGGRTGYSEEDFVCEFFVWDMPTKEQILSGNEITVREADRLSYMTYPHFTVQGMCVNGGIAYVGRSIEDVGQFLYAVDISANRLLSEIPLTDYKEVEGVCIYDGSIFVSQKNGVDTDAVNPAKIYQISFDY